MALEREKVTYWAKLAELLPAAEGKFVVIEGEDVAGLADSYDEALGIGYDRFGPGPFLVKRVARTEPLHYFSRDLS
jgi:hypothetical protein